MGVVIVRETYLARVAKSLKKFRKIKENEEVGKTSDKIKEDWIMRKREGREGGREEGRGQEEEVGGEYEKPRLPQRGAPEPEHLVPTRRG